MGARDGDRWATEAAVVEVLAAMSGRDTIHRSACQCDCGCGAVLVTRFDQWGDEPEQVYAEFSLAYHGGVRERLRAAWRVVRGKDPWLHSVVLQDDGLRGMRQAFGCDAGAGR